MNLVARFFVLGSLSLSISGCANQAAKSSANADDDSASLAVYREPAHRSAAALVFTPPMLQDSPPLELSRDLRQPSAFVGYPESVTEFFYLGWDDRQASGNFGWGWGSGGSGWSGSHDSYERRAISTKVGVLYR